MAPPLSAAVDVIQKDHKALWSYNWSKL